MRDIIFSNDRMIINLSEKSISQSYELAKWYTPVKIRIQGAVENRIRIAGTKIKNKCKIELFKCERAIYLFLIRKMEEKKQRIDDILWYNHDFAQKYTDNDIYRMMLALPMELKKNPTLIEIQSLYKVSKRQAIKIREMIPKDVYSLT